MRLIALQMLLSDRAKYYGLVLGIAFSTLLITNQAGIFLSVLEQTVRGINEYDEADIWVMKPEVESIEGPLAMPYVYIGRIRSVPGVAWALPYYSGSGRVKTPTGSTRTVSVYGLDEVTLFGAPKHMVLGNVESLAEPESIILDLAAYQQYFPNTQPELGKTIEIGGKRSKIVGLCRTSWTGMVYTKLSTALHLEGQSGRMASFFVVRSQPGADARQVARDISRRTGLKALSRDDFIAASIDYAYRTSGMVESFGTTIIVGLVVGIVIVGQTFYMFIMDNLRQFAALKAIGINNMTILSMLAVQALLVTFVGFGLGLGGSASLFFMMDSQQSLMRGMAMPWSLIGISALAIALIVAGSTLFSALRVLLVDPAIVYRG